MTSNTNEDENSVGRRFEVSDMGDDAATNEVLRRKLVLANATADKYKQELACAQRRAEAAKQVAINRDEENEELLNDMQQIFEAYKQARRQVLVMAKKAKKIRCERDALNSELERHYLISKGRTLDEEEQMKDAEELIFERDQARSKLEEQLIVCEEREKQAKIALEERDEAVKRLEEANQHNADVRKFFDSLQEMKVNMRVKMEKTFANKITSLEEELDECQDTIDRLTSEAQLHHLTIRELQLSLRNCTCGQTESVTSRRSVASSSASSSSIELESLKAKYDKGRKSETLSYEEGLLNYEIGRSRNDAKFDDSGDLNDEGSCSEFENENPLKFELSTDGLNNDHRSQSGNLKIDENVIRNDSDNEGYNTASAEQGSTPEGGEDDDDISISLEDQLQSQLRIRQKDAKETDSAETAAAKTIITATTVAESIVSEKLHSSMPLMINHKSMEVGEDTDDDECKHETISDFDTIYYEGDEDIDFSHSAIDSAMGDEPSAVFMRETLEFKSLSKRSQAHLSQRKLTKDNSKKQSIRSDMNTTSHTGKLTVTLPKPRIGKKPNCSYKLVGKKPSRHLTVTLPLPNTVVPKNVRRSEWGSKVFRSSGRSVSSSKSRTS